MVAKVLLALLLTLRCAFVVDAKVQGSLRGRARNDVVLTEEIFAELNASIEAVTRAIGRGTPEVRRIAAIEKSIAATFQALPKNSAGRLSQRSVRHIVHAYFAKEHGWLLEGLDRDSMSANVSELHSASILQNKAPALVESLLEDRQRGRGLALEDIVVMIEALEQLIFHESELLLHSAYTLNRLDAHDVLNNEEIDEVLSSYVILFRQGSSANLADVQGHLHHKALLKSQHRSWGELVTFEKDARMNAQFSNRNEVNPFQEPHASFDEVANIMRDLASQYGRWQDGDCQEMKNYLIGLDADGDGRVPLNDFYSQPNQGAFHFSETTDYLRTIGALEEAAGRMPQVRIPNYLTGPANCIARSSYFSVCCISECEGLMNELEGRVQAPTASASQLIRLVSGNLSSSTVDAPRELSQDLVDKLHRIAELHDGAISLHGRLFAQWIHYAFPNECPYPEIAATTFAHGNYIASEAEKDLYRARNNSAEPDMLPVPMSHWSDDEILPLSAYHHKRGGFGAGSTGFMALVAGLFKAAARIAPLLIILRGAYSAWLMAVKAQRGDEYAKAEKHLV